MAKLTVVDGRKADATRFAALIEPHYDGLYRAAYRLTRSRPDAEDLVQEVCARAYVHLSEIAALEQPRSWLHRVMYRLFVDLSRRYERTHVGSIEEPAALVCDRPGPAEEAERMFDRQRLDRAWLHLDQQQRVLLALHDLEGYTLAEINELTGIKEGTIKSRLHRARVRLGRLLQRDELLGAARPRAGGE